MLIGEALTASRSDFTGSGVSLFIGVIISIERQKELSSRNGAYSWVAIVSAKLNTIEGDGFVESIILGIVGTFRFGSERPSMGCSQNEVKIYSCGRKDLIISYQGGPASSCYGIVLRCRRRLHRCDDFTVFRDFPVLHYGNNGEVLRS